MRRHSMFCSRAGLRASTALSCLLVAACSGGHHAGMPDAGMQGLPDAGQAQPDTGVPDASEPDSGTEAQRLYLAFGADLPPAVPQRVRALLAKIDGLQITELDAQDPPATLQGWALALGDHPLAKDVIADSELTSLDAEGFVLATGDHTALHVLAARGKPSAQRVHANLGAAHGAYAALEQLGFAFLHPLEPLVPDTLVFPTLTAAVREQPRWPERTFHIHTQHPLELTELFQGWGKDGPGDAQGFTDMLPELDPLLEWLVANRQNGLEWFLLWADSWKDFADSDERIMRLGTLVKRVHDFGLAAGIDAPIAFAQQHSFRLLRSTGDLSAEQAEIDMRLDWLAQADFDFYGIEMGTSEFTSPDAERMLAWMNEVAKHLDEAHKRPVYVKVHCAAGQSVDGRVDPVSGGKLDFNFLPHYADPRLGVLPHTVQHYGLDDPAPTYGNTSFERIRNFIGVEAGTRPVVYYPETAYWVSFDIDVPLFLPLYGERRVHDLRLLASAEDQGSLGVDSHKGSKIQGQLVFSSGWEWGYWLNDLITARAAWNPHVGAADDASALRALLEPVTRLAGDQSNTLADWLHDVIEREQALLILGETSKNGTPSDIVMRNGQGYLQGWDTWDDVSKLAQGKLAVPMTQPDKLGIVDLRNPTHSGPAYSAEVEPLLAQMETDFAALYERGKALSAQIKGPLAPFVAELVDAMRMTALRARQVHGLYDYVDAIWQLDATFRNQRLADAKAALDEALSVVQAREAHYRVPLGRITAWRKNPTAYAYTYLWTVHTLFYWTRDEGKAIEGPLSPCYRNIINPVDLASGEGVGADLAAGLGSLLSSGDSRGCGAEPSSEPMYSR
jgi:hypothetical protein